MTTVGFIGSGNLGGTVARLAVAFSQRTFLPFGHGATAMMGQTITTTCQDRAIEGVRDARCARTLTGTRP
jgi:hypothetical protein